MIVLAADLQDPPELIPRFIEQWEGIQGRPGPEDREPGVPAAVLLRSVYYKLVRKLADVELLEHVTGFGLYDREVVEQLRGLNDPYPYVRGLISEFGYPVARIPYSSAEAQERRHQEQLLHPLRPGDARLHEPLESAAAARGDAWILHAPLSLIVGLRLPRSTSCSSGTRSPSASRRWSSGCSSSLRCSSVPGHRRRVRWGDSHPGAEAAAGRRARAAQLR